MDLDVQNLKIELIQWLTTIEDATTLKKLIKIRESESKATVYRLSKSERESVEKGLDDLKNGNVLPHSEARKVYGKWL